MNVGRRDIPIVLGDEIASIQFIGVSGVVDRKPIPAPHFDPKQTGFFFFEHMESARKRFEQELKERDEQIAILNAKTDKVEAQVNTTVIFGVFLVAASLFAALLALILQGIGNSTALDNFSSLVKENLAAAVLGTIALRALWSCSQ